MKAPAAMKGMHFRMQVDVLDCLGCGNCVDVCPGNKNGKALSMSDLESQLGEAPRWDYCAESVKSKQHLVDIKSNVKIRSSLLRCSSSRVHVRVAVKLPM